MEKLVANQSVRATKIPKLIHKLEDIDFVVIRKTFDFDHYYYEILPTLECENYMEELWELEN